MLRLPTYKPFSAFTAMEDAQLALILATVHPAIDSVLLAGKTGTGKTELIRAYTQLIDDRKVIKLPLSITEEALDGNIDIERTLTNGIWKYENSFLDSINTNILFIDNINLLSSNILNKLLQIQERGYYVLGGKSDVIKPCRFTLVATMNPDEGGIPTKVLDRFSLFVNCDKSNSKHFRVEILQQENEFNTSSKFDQLYYQKEEDVWREKIASACSTLSEVKVKPTDIETIAQICKEAFVAGHRGDLALLWAAMANASLKGRKYITFDDIRSVKDLALIHRIRSPKQAEKDEQPQEQKKQKQQSPQNKQDIVDSLPLEDNKESNHQNSSPKTNTSENHSQYLQEDNQNEELFEIGELKIQGNILQQKFSNALKKEGVGKRIKSKNTEGNGRHIRSVAMQNEISQNIDIVATIRTAAPYQKLREPKHLAISIHKEDLQKKKREHRIGNNILFLVDTSGSMGIQQRMTEAKAGVFSLLKNAYVNRDTVGLMTFRKEEAELILPPTRSIEKAYHLLKSLKTGGRTPLLHALKSALNLLTNSQIKNKENVPLLVFFTDGKATSAYKHENTLEEIKHVALLYQKQNINSIVIDTECGFLKLGYAQQIAEWLGARYYHLDQLKEKTIKSIIEK